jgi:hypothetical protein
MISGIARLTFMMKMKRDGYEYELEAQPEAVLQRFFRDSTDPEQIAKVMVECFGTVIICREASYSEGKHQTILDAIDFELNSAQSRAVLARIRNIAKALVRNGVMPTCAVSQKILNTEYNKDPVYSTISTI